MEKGENGYNQESMPLDFLSAFVALIIKYQQIHVYLDSLYWREISCKTPEICTLEQNYQKFSN